MIERQHLKNMFQFHTGSIKRGGTRIEFAGTEECFNSILVRLKGADRNRPHDYILVSIPYWFD